MSDYLTNLLRFGGHVEIDVTDLATRDLTDDEAKARVLVITGVATASSVVIYVPSNSKAVDYIVDNYSTSNIVTLAWKATGSGVTIWPNTFVSAVGVPGGEFYTAQSLATSLRVHGVSQSIQTKYSQWFDIDGGDLTLSATQRYASHIVVDSATVGRKLILGQAATAYPSPYEIFIFNQGSETVTICGSNGADVITTITAGSKKTLYVLEYNGVNYFYN